MRTIVLTNQKGGVGKTTTAHVLAVGLADRGYKVLVVDTDPQTNLTFSAGVSPMETQIDLYDLMKGEGTAKEAIQKSNGGFDIIAGSLDLAGADMEFARAGREYILKELLEPVEAEYDFCVIDTPPTLGILTVNALTASDRVVVPMDADAYSLQGLSQLNGMISNVRKYCNNDLVIDGLLLTKYNPRTNISKQMRENLKEVAEGLHTRVYDTSIRDAVAIKETQLMQTDIFKEYPKANVTTDYNSFIEELLEGMA